MVILNAIFLLSLFLLVASLAYWMLIRWLPNGLEKRRHHLIHVDQNSAPHRWQHLGRMLSALLLKLAPWSGVAGEAVHRQPSGLQLKFLNAGWRSGETMALFLGSKTLLTLGLPAGYWLVTWTTLIPSADLSFWSALMAMAIFGYYLPDAYLRYRMTQRQKIFFHALPDALDLMRLCVQAGLGLDAAIDRVGREMRLSCPPLSDEFALTGLELRAGSSRSDALRHMSQRMGLADMSGLVSMLIQADRFGTSIAESLEVHSDGLRTQRRLVAEEAASKLPIKLLIPLIFCVFPALMTVLLGPVVISISQYLFPLVNNF